MKTKSSIIQLKGIQTVYEGDRIPVIRDINFTVEYNDFLAIIGPNGAGKTTLLETINGILPYRFGSGKVFDKDIKKNTTTIRKQIGYVIQNFELDPQTTFLCKDVVMSGRSVKIGLFRFPSKADWDVVW